MTSFEDRARVEAERQFRKSFTAMSLPGYTLAFLAGAKWALLEPTEAQVEAVADVIEDAFTDLERAKSMTSVDLARAVLLAAKGVSE